MFFSKKANSLPIHHSKERSKYVAETCKKLEQFSTKQTSKYIVPTTMWFSSKPCSHTFSNCITYFYSKLMTIAQEKASDFGYYLHLGAYDDGQVGAKKRVWMLIISIG